MQSTVHAIYKYQQNAESMIQNLWYDRCEIQPQCELGMEYTVKPLLMASSLHQLQFCPVDCPYIHSYFKHSTRAVASNRPTKALASDISFLLFIVIINTPNTSRNSG